AVQTVNLHGKRIGALNINNDNNIVLSAPLIINNNLQFVKGRLQCGAYKLHLGQTASIQGGGPATFIETDGPGQVRKWITKDLSAYFVPLGKGDNYAPLSISSTGSYNNAYVEVSFNPT